MCFMMVNLITLQLPRNTEGASYSIKSKVGSEILLQYERHLALVSLTQFHAILADELVLYCLPSLSGVAHRLQSPGRTIGLKIYVHFTFLTTAYMGVSDDLKHSSSPKTRITD